MKKLFTLVIVFAFIFSVSAYASTNQPLKNLKKGIDDMAYGQVEVPDSISETQTKGTPAYPKCTDKTKDDAGRGIAKFGGGLWRVLTFWYPEEDSTAGASSVSTESAVK